MAEYNPSKIIKDGNTYNFRDTTKIPLAGTNALAGSIVPDTDNAVDIGDSSKNIKMIYTKGITINGTQFLPSDYATLNGLSAVATSGSYNDLSNKPTIPTVNNGTLTIQQNGTTVDTFTANSSSDKTVNIQCVDLTSNQTVGGIKTFSNAPVVGSINLDGKTIDTDASGNMTYDSYIVGTIEEQGNNYIRYSSGLQICWGMYSRTAETSLNISFPKAFINDDTHQIGVSVGGQSQALFVAGWSGTVVVIGNANAGVFTYTAIGCWK